MFKKKVKSSTFAIVAFLLFIPALLFTQKVQLIFIWNSEAFDEPVSVFGDVTQIDITIPEAQQ